MPKQTATTPAPSQLYMTMVDTQQVTNTAGKQIRDSQLDKINSNLNTLLIGATASMDEPLSKTGLKASKLKSDTPKQAHDQKLVDALKEAQLNVVYDRVYASRMLIKVQAIIMLMDKTKQTSSSKSMQDFVSTQKPSFEAVKKSFEDYNKGAATTQ